MDADAAEAALEEFEENDLARQRPAIASSWRQVWNEVIPFLNFPPEVRRLIYLPNSIGALNSKIRRAVRIRGHFQSDEAAAKLIHLALNATSIGGKRSVREWYAVRSQLAIRFEDRVRLAQENASRTKFGTVFSGAIEFYARQLVNPAPATNKSCSQINGLRPAPKRGFGMSKRHHPKDSA